MVTLKGVEVLRREGKGRKLGIADVSQALSDDFCPVAENGLRLWKNLSSSTWLRVSMPELRRAVGSFNEKYPREAYSSTERPILILSSEYVSRAEMFLPDGAGGYMRSEHSANMPLTQRSFPARHPVFRLSDLDGDGYAYLRVKTNIPLGLVLFIEDEASFHELFTYYLVWYMAFYSFLGTLALTYFFFYMMTGDREYFLVAIRQTMLTVCLFTFNGYLQYYFRAPPWAVEVLYWLSGGLYLAAHAFFCKRLLLNTRPAWTRNMFFALAAAAVIQVAAVFLRSPLVSCATALLIIAASVLFFVSMGIVRFCQGYRLILLFVLSRLSFALGVVFLLLDTLLPWPHYLYKQLFMFFFLLDPILLAFMMIPGTRKRFESCFALASEQDISYEILEQRDGITGLYNKGHFMALADRSVQDAQSAGKPLAFIMMNIDHLQKFNEAWGCPEGDKMMNFLAQLIRRSLREHDVAAHYGGGEFCVVLPGETMPSAILAAERIRQSFEKQTRALDEEKTLTLSLGLSFLTPQDTLSALLQRSAEALDRAKANGHNRTEFETPTSAPLHFRSSSLPSASAPSKSR